MAKKSGNAKQWRLAKNPPVEFSLACEAAGIPATYRQFRRWSRGEGKAFANKVV